MKYFLLILIFCWVIYPRLGFHPSSMLIKSQSHVLPDSLIQQKTEYVFIGAEACATRCHNSDTMGHQYDIWKESLHAKSYQSLTTEKALKYCREAGITEDPWESLACLKCHVTASEANLLSLGSTYRKEDGVTCEACHKGEFHPKTFLPNEADCLKCHNASVHEVATFDFRDRCNRIAHPRPKAKIQL